MTEQAEVIVVGMGPGSEDAAERLAEAGLDVVGIDGRLVGGECPYWGCVPSKMMIRAAGLLAEGRRIPGMAGGSTVSPDWAPVAERIRKEATDDWDDTVAVERFEGKGGRFVRGWARLEGPRTVVVGDRTFEASKAVVLGVGASSWTPPVPGLDHPAVWNNRDAIETEEVPASLAVIGGGPIGVELGQVFRASGPGSPSSRRARAHGPRGARGGRPPGRGLRRGGHRGADRRHHHRGRARRAPVHRASRGTRPGGGRTPAGGGRPPPLPPGLGLETIGIAEDAHSIPVDDHLRVVEGVWAIGDATAKGAFTHVSMYQADIVVNDILGNPVTPADYKAVPRVTFTDPEIGSVGLNERSARQQGLEIRVGFTEIPSSTRGWIHKVGNRGYIKLIEDARRGVLVGASSAGPAGGEVLSLLTLAVHAEVPTERLRHMIYAYPTFHRAIEAAVKDLSAS